MLEILPDHLDDISEDIIDRLSEAKVWTEWTTPGSLACGLEKVLLRYAPDLAGQYANLSETDKRFVAYDVALVLAEFFFIYDLKQSTIF